MSSYYLIETSNDDMGFMSMLFSSWNKLIDSSNYNGTPPPTGFLCRRSLSFALILPGICVLASSSGVGVGNRRTPSISLKEYENFIRSAVSEFSQLILRSSVFEIELKF